MPEGNFFDLYFGNSDSDSGFERKWHENILCEPKYIWLVGWLFGFYGISTFVGYSMPNPFLNNQFYFKQFSSAWVHSLSKTFLFQAIQFIQIVLIQFSVSIDFVYTVECQNNSILNNWV